MSKIIYSEEDVLAARQDLWRKGNLEWKLSPTQKRMHAFWKTVEGKQSVFNCGRRIGKSYWLCIVALEQCLQKPKSIVKFFQPEKGQVKTNVRPLMDLILEDCPNDVRPEYKTQESCYVFNNGSMIQLGGTDKGNHEKLRGGDAHLCLIDEAGFLQAPLKYLIKSILGPSTMRTFGKIILSSSTPVNPDHEFVKYMERTKLNGTFFEATSKECMIEHEAAKDPRFTRQMYQALLDEYPDGEQDEEFRRECLNELITDGKRSIIPEFTKEVEKETIVEWAVPPFCDRYVAMDVGFKDLTVVLFGFYDFKHDVIVVQDELLTNGPQMTTDVLASSIFKKERELWRDIRSGETPDPYKRVSDNNNLTLLNDLRRLYSLNFSPTEKKDKEAHLNNLRVQIANFQIIISPKCKNLIQQIKNGTWDKDRKSFSRSADNGHYDAIDALIYLARNVERGKNPYPPGYHIGFIGPASNVFIKPGYEPKHNDSHEQLLNLFKVKKR